MHKNRRLVAIMLLVCTLIASLVLPHNAEMAYADVDANASQEILKKALVQNMKYCYEQNAFVTQIKELNYKSNTNLMSSWGKKDGTVYLPNMVGNTIKDGNLSCLQVLDGYNKSGQQVSSIFALFNKSSHPSLSNYGYGITEESSDDSKQGCVSITYSYTNETSKQPDTGKTNEICVKIKSDGYMEDPLTGNGTNIIDNGGGSGPLYLEYRDGDVQLRSRNSLVMGSIASFNAKGKWSDVKDIFAAQVKNQLNEEMYYYRDYGYLAKTVQTVEKGGETYQNAVLDKSKGPNSLLTYLSGSNNFTAYGFGTIDKYHMYTAYLNDAIHQPGSILRYGTCSANKETAIQASSDGIAIRNGSQWCALENVSSVSTKYNGAATPSRLTPMKFSDLMTDLMNLNYNYIEEQGVEIGTVDNNGNIDNPLTPDDSGSGSPTETTQTCYTAAGPLGWIMCAVTDSIGKAATYLYSEVIQPFLEIDANNLLNRDNGVYSGWSTFRNAANIIFVILFIIVILAQVTGIGVSNYNVKKILPRLIMVAILVNISFIICQLAVDVSNILGNGLKAAFDALPVGSKTVIEGSGSITAVTNKSGFAALTEGVLAILAQGGLIGAGVLAFGTVGLWLPTFLITLIGCIISIIFFFIILAVRQAGVIILVVLAPVAIVCYALPNTKSFFDRWKKMFSALLMVYPICGLLIGGGNYASALLLSTNTGFFYILAAMLLTVVPFFMIPSILKGSMAMMGNLGMQISNFGKNIGRSATGTVRGSEAFKNYQRQKQFSYDAKKANKLYDKIQKLEAGQTGDKLEEVRSKHKALYRRHALHDAAARRIQAEDARAYAQTSAGRIDVNGDRNMLNEARQAALATETKNARANYESGTAFVTDHEGKVVTGSDGKRIPIRANDINALGAEYLNRLNQLQENPTSRSALTSVRALQDMMMESDAGRTMIKNKQLEHALKYQRDYDGTSGGDKSQMALAQASEHLLSSQHQGNIKSHNRSTWSMEQAFNRGDYSQLFGSNGITALDRNGHVIPQGSQAQAAGYGISAYEQQGLDGYDESSLVGADEGALQSMNRAIQDIQGLNPSQAATPEAKEEMEKRIKQKATITSLAGSAYGKESLSTQGKVAEQLRKMIINGNTASTIASTDVKALNKLAGDIGQQTLTGQDQKALVKLAQDAFSTNSVKDAEHAAALNSILTAAGQQTVAWSGRMNTNGQNGSSGPIPVRNAGSGSGAGTPPGIIVTGDLSGEAIRNLANQNRQNNNGSGGQR